MMKLLLLFAGFAFAFNYSNCGTPDDPWSVLTWKFSPSILKLGENVTIDVVGKTDVDCDNQSTGALDLTIWKQVFGAWVEIPCVAGVGSCTYWKTEGWCAGIEAGMKDYPQRTAEICNALQHGTMPCGCPIDTGTYSIRDFTFPLPKPPSYLSWLVTGSYKIQLVINDNNQRRLSCMLFHFTFEDNSVKLH